MITTTITNAALPTISGKLLFHVIVDDFLRTFSIDGPGGRTGYGSIMKCYRPRAPKRKSSGILI